MTLLIPLAESILQNVKEVISRSEASLGLRGPKWK